MIPSVDRPEQFSIRLCDKWLTKGERPARLSDFCAVVDAVPSREMHRE